jgi:hypothetical protein
VKPYDELRASALRTLIRPQNDAHDAVLDDAEPSLHDAALGILRELGGADEIVWRNECETYGYYFDPDEFREIVEELVADWLVRVHYEDPRFAEERHVKALYMRFGAELDLDEVIELARERDPDGSIAAMYENPPIYEAADM